MIIDCERCEVRDIACGECVVGVLLGMPAVPGQGTSGRRESGRARHDEPPGAAEVQLDAPERRALQVLADQGLVPRLRLVAGPPRSVDRPGDPAYRERDVG